MVTQEQILKWKREQAKKMQNLAEASELYDEQYKEFDKKTFLDFCWIQEVSAIELYFFRKYNGKSIVWISKFEDVVETRKQQRKRAREAFKESMKLYNATKHGQTTSNEKD